MKDKFTKVFFRSQKKRSFDFDLLHLGEIWSRDYYDHSPFELHQVQFFIMMFVKGGTGVHTIDFVDYNCEEGTVLVIRKDQIHKFSKTKLQGTLVLFTLDFLGSYFEKNEAQKSLILFNDFLLKPLFRLTPKQFDICLDIIKRIKEEYFDKNDAHSPGIIRSELQILISKLYRLKTESKEIRASRKYLSEFIQFHNMVEERYNRSLKVKEYAAWLGISTKTLNTVTQSIINKNAKEFIDEICLNHIKRKLINSESTIKEICFEVGFKETSNFYTYFRKRTDLTPEAYRRSYR